MYPRAGGSIIMKTWKCYSRAGENIIFKKTEIKVKSFEKFIQNKDFKRYLKTKKRNTGYPAKDPTENKFISGSGWEIKYLCCLLSYVCLLCVVCCVLMFSPSMFMFVLLLLLCGCSIVNAKA